MFVFSALGCLVAWFGVNVPKGRLAAAQWASEKRGAVAGVEFLDEKDHRESSEAETEGKSDRKI